ncbi:hypothetical protein Esti_000172 [Eimeria stiedai]
MVDLVTSSKFKSCLYSNLFRGAGVKKEFEGTARAASSAQDPLGGESLLDRPEPILRPLMSVGEGQRRQDTRGPLRQSICLRSSPFVLFFQTLLPWNELDLTGKLISGFCITPAQEQ